MAIGDYCGELSSNDTLIDLVARWGAETPDAPAFTFVDYGADPHGRRTTITWSQTHRRAGAIAARLRRAGEPGERVALLLPQGLEYITTMLGAMYARMVAVPLFSPELPGQSDRLVRTYADADPAVVVTTSASRPQTTAFLDKHHVAPPRDLITADTVEPADWTWEPAPPDDVAYLQYTSGSTRDPAGVQITHRNIAVNARQLWRRLGIHHRRPVVTVSWLPLFHDMGLITTLAAPAVHGIPAEFTDPMAFIRHPARWLSMISAHTGEEVFLSAPNFAYEYCVARVRDTRAFDLRGLRWCLNGAEPVRRTTLRRFADAFSEAGLRPGAQSPCYGLAEATVFVTAASDDVPPRVLAAEPHSLSEGVVVRAAPDDPHAVHLVSCGTTAGQFVAVVDPETHRELPDGHIGEIWVHGPNVARGYWRNPERTRDTFGARLNSPAPGVPAAPWLRTGDLGVILEGELYVTGRIKDLIIIDGRNHFPQDIEATVQEAHPAVRADHVAAFTIPGETGERVVVAAERSRHASSTGTTISDLRRIVLRAVSDAHELAVHDFVLVRPGGVPRTSSGKVARNACKQRYLAGDLPTA